MLFVLAVSAAMAASDYAALNRLKELHHLCSCQKLLPRHPFFCTELEREGTGRRTRLKLLFVKRVSD
jgi:hypothetical protein